MRTLKVFVALSTLLPIAGAQTPAATAELPPSRRAQRVVKQLELVEQRTRALWDLVQIGPPAVAALEQALDDPREGIVLAAVQALGFIGPQAKATLPRLRQLCASDTPAIRNAAGSACDAVAGGRGHVLCVDFGGGKLIELDGAGRPRWELDGFLELCHARLLASGCYLIVDRDGVREIRASGETKWSFDTKGACHAARLDDGQTLIADTENGRVVEADAAGRVRWTFAPGGVFRPVTAERLSNGRTLICDYPIKEAGRILEIERDGKVVWELPWQQPSDAERLPGDLTLITSHKPGKVSVVDREGRVRRSIESVRVPSRAVMLPNRHILIAGEGVLCAFDESNRELWRVRVPWASEVQRH